MEDTVLVNMKIPMDWICTYRQIQSLLIDYGVDAIAGCDNVCSSKNKEVIQLWNLFKNAVYVYYKEDTDKAIRIYNFVTNSLKKYDGVNLGTSKLHIEDSEIEVTCTGNDYEFADTSTSYIFEAIDSSQLDIKDDGLGQTIRLNIKSDKIVTIGTKEEIYPIGYNFVLDNPDDDSWINYSILNNTIVIRENKDVSRVANFTLVQHESGNTIKGKITQEVNNYTYRYTINIDPPKIDIPAEGGSKFFTIESYKELIDEEGSVIGDRINVPYIAFSSSKYFTVLNNRVSAEENLSEIRTAAIIIEREELGPSGNKKIDLFQDSLNKEIRYRLSASVDTNIIDADGVYPVTLSVESYKETFINGVSQGDRTNIPYTVTSDKGLLKNYTSDKNKWYMSANDTTNVRTDSLIIKQTESGKSETIDIKQNPAQENIEYVFTSDIENLTPPSTGQNVILNIQSYKQYYINGKPTTKTPVNYTGNVVSGGDFISINSGLPNSISIAQNSGESERSGKILYSQGDGSGKTIEVRITQSGASIRYEYYFSIDPSEVSLRNVSHSATVTVTSYRQKYINDSPSGGQEDVGFSLQKISGNADESQYGGVSLSPNGNIISITSGLNTTNQVVSLNYRVIQNASSGEQKSATITITKAASSVEDLYFLEVATTTFNVDANPSGRSYFEVTKNERRHYVNGEVTSIEDNLHWEPISNNDWITVGNQDETYFICSENTNYLRDRDGTITIRLVADHSTTVTLNINQAQADRQELRYMDCEEEYVELTPSQYRKELWYKLYYRETINGKVVNGDKVNGLDETDKYGNGQFYSYGKENCGNYCDNWYFGTNVTSHTIDITYMSNGEVFATAVGKYRTTDGQYDEKVYADYSQLAPTTLLSATVLNANNSTYDFFYHYIPTEFKCLYTDLIKIFINAHGDNYKLRKAVYNLNLFQSLIAAYFFEDKKKVKLFLDCIIAFTNNYFKENDILYEYRLNGIDDDGHVYLDILPCQEKNNVRLELSWEDGRLYEIDESINKEAIDFELENDNLIAIKHGYRKEGLGKSNSNCC